MYFISCFTRLEKDKYKLGYVETGSLRCVGFVETYEHAVEVLHNNTCDIREYTYSYGLIEKYNAGIYPYCPKENRQFFKWDDEKNGFYEIDEPEFVEYTCNFAIG